MSEFENAFADATKANQTMLNSYTATLSDIENYKLTVGKYEQTLSDLERQHDSALKEKEAVIHNMQK